MCHFWKAVVISIPSTTDLWPGKQTFLRDFCSYRITVNRLIHSELGHSSKITIFFSDRSTVRPCYARLLCTYLFIRLFILIRNHQHFILIVPGLGCFIHKANQ